MGADEVDAGRHPALRRTLRQPAVAALGGAPHGGLRRPADPDRHGRLHRPRTLSDVVELPALALVRRELVGQRGPHGVDGLVEQPPAVGERHVERLELALHVPGADAEDRAAARELVERGPRLGHGQRMAVREHVHVAQQPHPLGDGRQVRERGDRVPPRGAHGLGLGGGDGDVVAHGHVVEAGRLARLGHLHELGDARRRAPTAARRSCSAIWIGSCMPKATTAPSSFGEN